MRFFACFAPPRVLGDDCPPCKDQLHELYHYKLNEQRALDTPQGGIKARRPSAPASAPAALAPPLQRCRPASLELACSDATDLCELAGERGRVQAAGRGCEGWRAAAGADCKGGAACCAARGGDAAGGGAVHGADAELSSLMRTLSPSDFSFSELLSGEGGRAGSAFARGGSGVRRSLNFEAEACAARGLCDSSDGCESVTFPTVWSEDDAENCEPEADLVAPEEARQEEACCAPSAAQHMLRAVVEEGLALQAAADEGRALHAAMERSLARQAAAERGAAAAPVTEAACRPARAPQCAAAPAGMAAGPCLAAPAAPAGAAIAAALPPPQLDCASPRGALEGPPPAGTSAHALRAALASAAPPLTGEPVAEGAPSAALLPAAALSPGAPGGGCTPRHKRSPSGTGADWRAWEACSQSASA